MMQHDKRMPVFTAALIVIAIVVIAGMILNRQRRDLEMLESTYQNINTKRILLQYEQSEKQRELNISSTSDYIAARARENGYMMPGEIRFVVRNPEALTQHETLTDVRLEAVSQAAEQPAETAGQVNMPDTAAAPVEPQAADAPLAADTPAEPEVPDTPAAPVEPDAAGTEEAQP